MPSFTERYHELTKYNPQTIDKLGNVSWNEQPIPFKDPRVSDKILLHGFLRNSDGSDEIEEFQPESLDSRTLAHLMHFTGGITAKVKTPNGDMYLRANPSAGGLYPTEIYIAVKNTQDIPDGLYHYHSLHMALYPIRQGNWERLYESFITDDVTYGQWVVILTGIFSRSSWRYKDRAYRRILLDTGHVLGNLLELCDHWNIPSQVIGGFYDDELEKYLNLIPKEESPLMVLSINPKGTDVRSIRQQRSISSRDAVKTIEAHDPVQIQQNACERISRYEDLLDTPDIHSQKYVDKKKLENALEIISLRRSSREYTGESITRETMNRVLEFSYGKMELTKWTMVGDILENYVLVLNVDTLEPGIYSFNPHTLELKLKIEGDFKSEIYQICLGQNLASACSFAMIHTVDLPELMDNFGDRGYRYICVEAGQIGQRVNLISQKLGIGSSGIGGYFDDLANEHLELPLNHAILYITTVGVPK